MPEGREQLVIEVLGKNLLGGALNEAVKQAEAAGGKMNDALQVSGSAGFDRLFQGLTGALGPAGRQLADVGREVAGLGGGFDSVARSAGLSGAAIAGLGVGAGVLAGVGSALYYAAQQSSQLEKSLEAVQLMAGVTGADLDRYKEKVYSLANSTGVASEDIQKAFSVAATSGVRGDLGEFVQVAVNASTQGFASVAEAASRLSDVLDGFGLESARAADALEAIHSAAVLSGKSGGEFAAALAVVSQEARALNIPLEDTAAVLAAITAKGVPTGQAAAGLVSLFGKLSQTTGRTADTLRSLGADVSASAIQSRGFVAVARDIGRALDGSNPKFAELGRNASDVRAELFGTGKAAQAAFALFEDQALGAVRATDQLRDSYGSAGRDAARIFNNASRQVDQFQEKIANAIPQALGGVNNALAAVVGDAFEIPIEFDRVAIQKQLDEIAVMISRSRFDAAVDIAQGLGELTNIRVWDTDENGREFQRTVAQAKQFSDAVAVLNRALLDTNEQVRATGDGLERLSSFGRDAGGKIVPLFEKVAEDARALSKLGPLPSVEIPIEASKDTLGRSITDALEALPVQAFSIALKPTPASVQEALATVQSAIGKSQIDIAASAGGQGKLQEVAGALQTLNRFSQAQASSEQLLGSLRSKSLDGLERQVAENRLLESSFERQILALEREGVETSALADALGKLRASNDQRLNLDGQRQGFELEQRMASLRASSLEKERDLALAAGDVAAADELSTRAIAARGAVASLAAEADLRALRERLVGNDTLLAALNEIESSMQSQVFMDERLALGAKDRALAERDRATDSAILDAQFDLLSGLDRELEAIERNRVARAREAEESVRSGKLKADALNDLLLKYDALAVKDSRAAQREALGSEFDRAARGSSQFAATVEETRLLEAAFVSAREEARALGLQGEQAARFIEDGMRRARTGVDALSAGLRGGFEDFRRSVFDDFSFGARAATSQAQTFKDAWIDAFAGIGEKSGSDILRDFARANLEQLRDNLAEFSFNKFAQAALPPDIFESLKGPASPLDLAAQQLDLAGVQLLRAADALSARGGSFSGPSTTGGEFGFAIPPYIARPPDEVEPNNYVELQQGAQNLSAAGQAASTALASGAQAAGASLAAGGQQAASAFLGSLVGSLGNAAAKAITGALGFAEGGLVRGATSPWHAQNGGVYRAKTLLEVAELPGLQEAVIPLKGGKVPVAFEGGAIPPRERRSERERTTRDGGGSPVTVSVQLPAINITVQGGGGRGQGGARDMEKELLSLAPVLRREFAAALDAGIDRRLTEAIRGAVR